MLWNIYLQGVLVSPQGRQEANKFRKADITILRSFLLSLWLLFCLSREPWWNCFCLEASFVVLCSFWSKNTSHHNSSAVSHFLSRFRSNWICLVKWYPVATSLLTSFSAQELVGAHTWLPATLLLRFQLRYYLSFNNYRVLVFTSTGSLFGQVHSKVM